MLVLSAADTLRGASDAANKVTYSIFGMTLVSGAEAYSCLAQGQLAATVGTLYTAPNPGEAFIKTITIVNTDTVARTFRMFRGGTADANAITPSFSLAAGSMAVYAAEDGWTFYTANGAFIQNPYTTQPAYNAGLMGTSGCKGATFDRALTPEVNTTLTTTGQVYLQAIWLQAGTVVSNIKIWSATTGAGTPTHCNAGLYDSAGNLLATGTDLTSTAWAANTLRTFTMQTPYTVPTAGLYYVAYSTVATTCPTIKGPTARTNGALGFATPILCGVSGTSYATGNMPATLVLPAAAATTGMYAEVS